MINVFLKKIAALSAEETEKIIRSLSKASIERLNKKKNEALYLASLCALSLLTDEQRADLDYTESGRPFFKTLDLDISISHSQTHAAVAISSSKSSRVGVDIEDDTRSPSPRFLTESEQATIQNGDSYVKIWTKKEALFKYLKNDDVQFIRLDSTSPEIHGAKFITLALENNIMTVCSKTGTVIQII